MSDYCAQCTSATITICTFTTYLIFCYILLVSFYVIPMCSYVSSTKLFVMYMWSCSTYANSLFGAHNPNPSHGRTYCFSSEPVISVSTSGLDLICSCSFSCGTLSMPMLTSRPSSLDSSSLVSIFLFFPLFLLTCFCWGFESLRVLGTQCFAFLFGTKKSSCDHRHHTLVHIPDQSHLPIFLCMKI